MAAATIATLPLHGWHAAADAPDPMRPTEALIGEAEIAAVQAFVAADIVAMTVSDQNRRHADLEQADIDALDQRWRREREEAVQPLIAATLANPLSTYLTRIQAHSLGLYTEIFVMDHLGLNVGQSAITSDFWQGDEAKFQKTTGVGPTAVFIDAAEFHEPSRTWRAQLNVALPSRSGDRAAGAATFEINLTELQRRTR